VSYSEENGQVVLRMSREDYEGLLVWLGYATAQVAKTGMGDLDGFLTFLNRLNEGNPHYTPYQVEEKKS
jgi:hypothetical protein